MLPSDELKRRLDAFRTLRGMRQTDLADRLAEDGHGKHDLGRLERGDERMPLSASLRRSIAAHLEIPERWLTDEHLDLAQTAGEPSLDDRLARIETALEDRNTRVFGILQANSQQLEQISKELLGRLDALEKRMAHIEQVAISRVGADAAAAHTTEGPGEAPGAEPTTGHRRPR